MKWNLWGVISALLISFMSDCLPDCPCKNGKIHPWQYINPSPEHPSSQDILLAPCSIFTQRILGLSTTSSIVMDYYFFGHLFNSLSHHLPFGKPFPQKSTRLPPVGYLSVCLFVYLPTYHPLFSLSLSTHPQT